MNKWAEERLRELIRSVEVKVGAVEAEISEITKIEGESSMNIRKGKKLVGYDYDITMKWKCKVDLNHSVNKRRRRSRISTGYRDASYS